MNKIFSDKEKNVIRAKLRTAMLSGKVIRPEMCEMCGIEALLHGHHDDYSKPLEVRWLCVKCHKAHHNETGFAKTSKYEYTNVRMFSKTHLRLKLKSVRAGKSLMQYLDELSKQ